MKSIRLSLIVPVLLVASIAQAQATRTWVEGNGNDANPCSFTAPCKTFAGALTKTATNGTISVQDAGAYGAVTVSKGLTIDGSESLASVLATLSSTGIIVNAPSTEVVVLRNLDIIGATTGLDGIRILQAKAVYIENCRINGFAGSGIKVANTTNNIKVYVRDTVVRNNAVDGVGVLPTGTGTVTLTVENSSFLANATNGVHIAGANNKATVTGAVINGNANGVVVEQTTSVAFVEKSTISHNTGVGLFPGVGANTPIIHLSKSAVTGNATGINTSPGQVIGYSSNMVVGNTLGNSVNSSAGQQ